MTLPNSTASSTDSASAPPNTVVFLSGDLIFASRVQAAATAAGLAFRLSGNLPLDLSHPVSHVIVDLSTRSKVVEELMPLCQSHYPNANVIAYAPHVQVDRIRAARTHGIPTVLTRGQFNEALSTMF